MIWRKRISFWLEFDPETLLLMRLRPMDRRGKILASPGDPPFKAGTLVTTIKAKDEAGLRRDYDFKGLALVLRAEREALSRTFRLVIDGLPDSPARRALQLCLGGSRPRRTLTEATAEVGCDEGDVRYALSTVYMEVTRRMRRPSCYVYSSDHWPRRRGR
jgi:hypothetical protein